MFRQHPELEPFDDGGALLSFLLDAPTTHFTARELELGLGWDAVRTEDALAEVERAGLVHRVGPFAFPTHAAVRCAELLA